MDKIFYYFISSYEVNNNDSILIQSGKYYGLDLMPLSKIIYTDGNTKTEWIDEVSQPVDELLALVSRFYEHIKADNTVCEKIHYSDLDHSITPNQVGHISIKQEINPWNNYFKSGEILDDLGALIKSLKCYKENGADTIYLDVG